MSEQTHLKLGDGKPKPAGTWDYYGDGDPAHNKTGYADYSTFSIGVFQWVIQMSELDQAIALVLSRGRRLEFYQQQFADGGSMYHVKLWRDRWTRDEVKDLKLCSLPGSLAESILKAESCFEQEQT